MKDDQKAFLSCVLAAIARDPESKRFHYSPTVLPLLSTPSLWNALFYLPGESIYSSREIPQWRYSVVRDMAYCILAGYRPYCLSEDGSLTFDHNILYKHPVQTQTAEILETEIATYADTYLVKPDVDEVLLAKYVGNVYNLLSSIHL